jgi:hypothetical protein
MPDDQMTTPAPQTIPAATRSEINTQIRSIARVAGLDAARSDAQIDADAAAEAARAAAFDAMEARSAAPIRTTRASVGHDNDAPELRGADRRIPLRPATTHRMFSANRPASSPE